MWEGPEPCAEKVDDLDSSPELALELLQLLQGTETGE